MPKRKTTPEGTPNDTRDFKGEESNESNDKKPDQRPTCMRRRESQCSKDNGKDANALSEQEKIPDEAESDSESQSDSDSEDNDYCADDDNVTDESEQSASSVSESEES